jgi:F0F1-type ATP synthase membrane subunit c/vacuolar-type H+-ATPase subunit K
MSDDLGDDPGWRLSWKTLLVVLVPNVGVRLAKNSGKDSLQMLRSVFVSFCAAVVLIGVVVLVLGDIDPKQPDRPTLAVPIVVSVSVICLALQRFVPRPLDCTTPASLAATYRTRFFLRVALAETCSLVAFAVYILIGPGWVYLFGLGFTLFGFAFAAPTRAKLRADQDAMYTRGCALSLVAALRAR